MSAAALGDRYLAEGDPSPGAQYPRTPVAAAPLVQGYQVGDSGPRNPTGWILLAILFALMFVVEFAGSISNAATAKMDELDEQLKLVVQHESRGKPKAGGLTVIESQDSKDSLHSLETELAGQKKLDDLGRALYAAVLTEEGKPVPANVYLALLASKSDVARAFGHVYAPGKLTEAQALALQKRLNAGKTFVAKLAAVQAFEKAGDRTARARLLPAKSSTGAFLVQLLTLAIMAFSVLVWFGYFTARSNGDLAPLGLRTANLTLFQADLFAIRAVQLLAGWQCIGLICGFALERHFEAEPAGMFAEGILDLTFVVILFRLPLGPMMLRLADLGVSTEKLGRHILWGLAGFVAELPVTVILIYAVTALFRFLPVAQHPAEQELQQTTDVFKMAGILFLGTVVAAFWEEIMFRGLLFPALGRLCKSLPLGALFSSIIFASIHPQGAAVWPSLCVVGLMSCWLAHQTRSLVPSIVMHFCHNAALMAITIGLAR